jgi:Zn finger protein HypA/HybF involved in hydrogenase expression
MDLANMRQYGVRAIGAWCLDCDHKATVNVDGQPGHLAVKSFERRMKCSQCGSRRVDVRPAWSKKANANAVQRAL